jgi:2-polyprenyl-6-methoxyphenol hydroxylase-like FAD-dependent oxidoreductase
MGNAWDYTTDILVVGSGGGGMTAALMARDQGCDALVIEKAALYGGSTAMSGGSIWVPNNHLMAQAGLRDSPEEASTYLKTTTVHGVTEGRMGVSVGYTATPRPNVETRTIRERTAVHLRLPDALARADWRLRPRAYLIPSPTGLIRSGAKRRSRRRSGIGASSSICCPTLQPFDAV